LRHDGALQHLDTILEYRKLPDHAIPLDMYVRADDGGFDDGVLAHEDVVADLERIVAVDTAVELGWGPEDAGAGEEDVAADGDGDGDGGFLVWRRCGVEGVVVGGGGGRRGQSLV